MQQKNGFLYVTLVASSPQFPQHFPFSHSSTRVSIVFSLCCLCIDVAIGASKTIINVICKTVIIWSGAIQTIKEELRIKKKKKNLDSKWVIDAHKISKAKNTVTHSISDLS